MIVTVRSILDSSAILAGDPEVVAGHGGLDRAVRWVHVSEVRDLTGLLSGGELVLSTGLTIADPADALAYIGDIIDSGASGLVLELSTRLPRIPAAMIAAASAAKFPIIALHTPIRFISVTEQVHREIVATQYEDLQQAQHIHEAFTTLSLEGASADMIVKTASRIAGTSIVLEDLSRQVLSYANVGESEAELLRDWRRRSRLASSNSIPTHSASENWVSTPVGLHGQAWARLVVPDPAPQSMRPAMRLTMLLERAAQALQIGRMVERDRLGVEFQAQSGFVNDLRNNDIGTEADAAARAAALGLRPGRVYVPLAVHRVTDSDDDPVRAQRESRRLVEAIGRAARETKVSALIAMMSTGAAGLVLSIQSAKDEQRTIVSLVEAIHRQTPMEVSVGADDSSRTLLACGPGIHRADQVAGVAWTSGGPAKPYYRHSDIRLPGLMVLLREDPRVQSFAESELQRLLLHDARHSDGMLDLLRQFLAAGGNKSVLARDLNRSRPAIYKRLERLERLLGLPLKDAASRTSLSVALLVYDQSRPYKAH